MSVKHPIIAITGSSGAGTSIAKSAFEHMFKQEGIKAAVIEGDCFHRFDRAEMDLRSSYAEAQGEKLTHFGPEGNLFGELEALFLEYSKQGTGQRRYYIHDEEEASQHGMPPGSLTEWEDIEADTDIMFYEGLHGGLVIENVNIAQHVDLLIGETPIINLEWIQKIHRDRARRGYSTADAKKLILSRMYDYMNYITPQFSRTDINFQRVPTVDTSNPFEMKQVPNNTESFTVIHIRNREKITVDFRYLLDSLKDSTMSTPDTLLIPASKKVLAMQLILTPYLQKLVEQKNNAS